MSSIIKSRTISAVTEKAIQMSNSRWARLSPIAAGWTHIRVGIRYHFTDSGASLTGNPLFVVGFCSGTTNIPGDATPTHFAGVRTTIDGWTRSAGSGVNGVYIGNSGSGKSLIYTKNVAGTWTDTSTNINTMSWPIGAASNTADREILFLDLIFGSPNYTLKCFYKANTTGLDTSKATFDTQMALLTPSLSNYTFDSTGQTLAVDEGANGTFNAVCVHWNRTDSLLEVCDLEFARLA